LGFAALAQVAHRLIERVKIKAGWVSFENGSFCVHCHVDTQFLPIGLLGNRVIHGIVYIKKALPFLV